MTILLIEDDHSEMDFAVTDLKGAFPEAEILEFRSVAEFLNHLPDSGKTTADILILEHHLPLMQMGRSEEEMDQVYQNLITKFPWVGGKWDHQEAGEKTIRYIRRKNHRLPILIYTHSDFDSIVEDVRQDPRVEYLMKRAFDKLNLRKKVLSLL
jgi:hypothetical protein